MNDLTFLWNDLTLLWNDLTWNDLTMERSDRKPAKDNIEVPWIPYNLQIQLYGVPFGIRFPVHNGQFIY